VHRCANNFAAQFRMNQFTHLRYPRYPRN
jgi:hypothetical protein